MNGVNRDVIRRYYNNYRLPLLLLQPTDNLPCFSPLLFLRRTGNNTINRGGKVVFTCVRALDTNVAVFAGTEGCEGVQKRVLWLQGCDSRELRVCRMIDRVRGCRVCDLLIVSWFYFIFMKDG